MGIGFLDELPDETPNLPLALPEIDLSPQQQAFIIAYLETGSLARASKVSKINKFYHYHWKKDDPSYQIAFNLAEEALTDDLVTEARRRGKEGYDYEVIGKDGEIVKLRRYSDNLLMFAIKGTEAGKVYKDSHKGDTINVNIGNDAKVAFDFGSFRKLLDQS